MKYSYSEWSYKVITENDVLAEYEVSVKIRHKDYTQTLSTRIIDFKKDDYSVGGIFSFENKFGEDHWALFQTSVADHFITPVRVKENGVRTITLITEIFY